MDFNTGIEPLTCTMADLTVDQLVDLSVEQMSPLAHKTMAPPPALSLKLRGFVAPSGRKPLRISFTTSSRNGSPIFPATHLLLSFRIGGSMEVFTEELKPDDFHTDGSGNGVYSIIYPSQMLPRIRVPDNMETRAQVIVHAWKDFKFLDQWVVGEIEDLGYRPAGAGVRATTGRVTRSRKQVVV